MRAQDYAPPRLTLGAVGLIAIIIPIVLGYYLVSGMATSKCYEGLCGTTTTTTTASSAPVLSGIVKVSMPSGAGNPSGAPGYAPDNITVAVGTTVIWTNNDTVAHTVTSVTGNGSISSGNMVPGAVFNYTFNSPGTFNYLCLYHPWMTGKVVVVNAPPSGQGPSVIQVSMPSGAGAGPSGAPGYAPDKIVVVIGINNTVNWTNNDNVAHTVTSVTGNGSITSGNMVAGAAFNYTFTAPGTYNYLCLYHPWMTGTVVVKPGSAPPPTSSVIQVSMPAGAGVGPSGAPGYAPDKITVVIGINNTVEWTNNDTVHHTVTSVTGNGSISSGDMAPAVTFKYTFTAPGTYNYLCLYHPWMTGTVVVLAGPGSTTTSSSTTSTASTTSSSSSSQGAPPANAIPVSMPKGAGDGPSAAPGYGPDVITVVIGINNTVIWTNNDIAHHTVTSVTGNGTISSGDMPPGATFTYTFTTPGTYDYVCLYHPWMTGTVIVKAAA